MKMLKEDQLIKDLESEYELISVCGKGANATVYKAKTKKNEQVAVKRISLQNLSLDTVKKKEKKKKKIIFNFLSNFNKKKSDRTILQ